MIGGRLDTYTYTERKKETQAYMEREDPSAATASS
jgi:hypothetical protein